MTHNYTDYLGNPVKVGDTIVYPVQQGSSAANLTTGEVVAIEDIIPNDPSDPYCTAGHLHRDRNQEYPPYRTIVGTWDRDKRKFIRDDSKSYMLKVRRVERPNPMFPGKAGNKQVTLKNVDRIVVVSGLLPPATVSACSICGSTTRTRCGRAGCV